MILMSKEVLVFLFAEGLLLLLLGLAAHHSIRIIKSWDFTATSPEQYRLEKLSYLVVVLIRFTLIFKIVLLPFFVHMTDTLSVIMPGAMCAAGVVNASEYSGPLLILKVMIPLLAGAWLLLNRLDLRAATYPYIKSKLHFFLIIFTFVALESVLDYLFLSGLEVSSPVECCSALFGVVAGGGLPFNLNTPSLLLVFGLLSALSYLFSANRMPLATLLNASAYLFASYYAVVYFFGCYIYQLPTHQCPFCMLQPEYAYIGYALWGSLLLSTFTALAPALIKAITGEVAHRLFAWNQGFTTLFLLLASVPVLMYILRNGVLLS